MGETQRNIDLQQMRMMRLDFTRAGVLSPGQIIGKGAMLSATRNFLYDNPHVLADLDETHRKDPDRVTMAIVFSIGLVIARYEDKLCALVPTIGCTTGAISKLFNNTYSSRYGIYTSSPDYEDFRERIRTQILNGTTRFHYDYINPAENYIAASMEGHITEGSIDLIEVLLNGGDPALSITGNERVFLTPDTSVSDKV